MQPVARQELVDFETYRERREAERQRIFAIKAARRVHVGDVLTFLFENADTVRYQVQEMMLAEGLVKESAIQHELETYNALLGGPGALGCSLLIEIDDAQERRRKLTQWIRLPEHLYVRLDDDEKVYATFDAGQVGEDRLSAVQYLKFDTGGRVPVAVGCDLPEVVAETRLNETQRSALEADLAC